MNKTCTQTRLQSWFRPGLLTAITVGVLAAYAPSGAQAEGLRNPPPGGFALSRSVGKLAHVDDATAVFVNPANLLDLESSSVLVAPALIVIDRDIEADWGGSAGTIDNLKLLGGLFAAFPGSSDKFAWGIGLSVPYGQSVAYEKDFAFKYLAPHFTELLVISVSPTIAYQVSDSFSIGVGLDLMWSRFKLHQSYPWPLVTGDPASPDGNMFFKAKGTAVGGIIALNWDINPDNRISFTYRPAFDISYSGDFWIDELPALDPAIGVTENSDLRTKIEYPAIWSLGYGIDFNEKWRLGLGVEHLKWSSFETLELDVDNNSVLFPSTTLPQYWKDTWTYGVSGDYKASDLWTFRGGYWFIETPIPTATQAPNVPESDIHYWGVGARRTLGRHSLELSYAILLYEDRVITDNINPAFNGDYDLTASLFHLSYSYTFE